MEDVMANLRARLVKLEGPQKGPPVPVWKNANETPEEAVERYLAAHPEDAGADLAIIRWMEDGEANGTQV
jgi:hypothetical protein